MSTNPFEEYVGNLPDGTQGQNAPCCVIGCFRPFEYQIDNQAYRLCKYHYNNMGRLMYTDDRRAIDPFAND